MDIERDLLALLREQGRNAADRLATAVQCIRKSFNLGPVLVYWRDATGLISQHLGQADYTLVHMTGVRVRAPMHGLIPPHVQRWLLTGGECSLISSKAEHVQIGGRDKSQNFWNREQISSYVKIVTPDDSAVFVFNRTDDSKANPLTDGDAVKLHEFVIQSLHGLLTLMRAEPESVESKVEHKLFRENVERLHHLMLLGRSRENPEELIQEILLAAHGMFAIRGQILGTIFEVRRDYDPESDRSALYLERPFTVGVPAGLINVGTKKRLATQTMRDGKPHWAGLTAWVASNETALLVEDIEDRACRDERFPLRDWYYPLWSEVRSEIAVPIRDPRSRRVHGVLNFESRAPRMFKGQDVVLLEWFAQTAGAIMREAAINRLLRKLRPSGSLIMELQQKSSMPAKQIAEFLRADDVTIWSAPQKDVSPVPQPVAWWDPKVRLPTTKRRSKPETRREGWTARILQEPASDARAYLFHIWHAGAESLPGDDGIPSDAVMIPADGVGDGNKHAYMLFKESGKESIEPWVPHAGEPASISRSAVEKRFTTQLAIPLFNPREDPNRSERAAISPTLIGVLWVNWQAWTADLIRITPTREDMQVIGEVAQGLAHILDVQRSYDDPRFTGMAHDLFGNVWHHARSYAASELQSSLLSIFLRYFEELPLLYRSREAAAFESPRLVTLDKVVPESQASAFVVRRCMLAAIAIINGLYSEFDDPLKLEKMLKDGETAKLGDWEIRFGTDADVACDQRTFFDCLAILYNLVGNAHGTNCAAPRYLLCHVGDPSELQAVLRTLPGNAGGRRRGNDTLSGKAPSRVAESGSGQFLTFVVQNRYVGDESDDVLLGKMGNHFSLPTRGLGLVRHLVERVSGGAAQFITLSDDPASTRSSAASPPSTPGETSNSPARWVRFTARLPVR